MLDAVKLTAMRKMLYGILELEKETWHSVYTQYYLNLDMWKLLSLVHKDDATNIYCTGHEFDSFVSAPLYYIFPFLVWNCHSRTFKSLQVQ